LYLPNTLVKGKEFEALRCVPYSHSARTKSGYHLGPIVSANFGHRVMSEMPLDDNIKGVPVHAMKCM